MRLKAEQLPNQLKKPLLPLYLVTGDETLLVQEACDVIRAACREAGCHEREVLQVEGKYNWDNLLSTSSEMSLFAERKLIELRIPSGKPGTEGSKALQAYLANPNPDNVLLIVAGKIDKQSTNSKWFKALDQAGAIVQIWPVDAQQLPRWIQGRLQQSGLSIDPDALQLLSDRVEGNLLAAVQEIEKLRLLSDGGQVSVETIGESVADNARYNLFAMTDHALSGNTVAALKMLHGLRAEGTESPVILWSLSREIRLLYQCQRDIAKGQSANRAMQEQRVWDKRKPIVGAALQRHDLAALGKLMQRAAEADRAIKGMSELNAWDVLTDVLMSLSEGFATT